MRLFIVFPDCGKFLLTFIYLAISSRPSSNNSPQFLRSSRALGGTLMNFKLRCHIAAAGAVAALFLGAQTSHGAITGILNSDVEGFFGTTSDAFQLSEGPITPPWAPVGFALPFGPAGLPLPPLYAGYPNPNPPIASITPFPAPAGHAPGSPFTDGATSADYHIYGGIGGAGTYTRNAYVRLGNNIGTLMYLSQPSTAVGYAYEEAEFGIDYNVNAGGLMAGATLGTRPYLVYGSFLPGGSAEFGAEVNYWWFPTSQNNITGVTIYGAPVNLGSLQYDDYISNVTGPFVSLVPDTFGSNFLLGVAPGQTGDLELTGDMFLIGDPVSISVMAVPEPGSLAILAVGAAGMMIRSRKKKF
jgi:PEP-CTERM motif